MRINAAIFISSLWLTGVLAAPQPELQTSDVMKVDNADDVDFQALGESLDGDAKANACYVCSSPCSSIYCCSGSHPQCCAVNGYCGCCA